MRINFDRRTTFKVLQFIVMGFLIVAAVAIAATLLISLHMRKAPCPSSIKTNFLFAKGRLWASIDDGKKEFALIDTGTSMSVFPRNWRYAGKIVDTETAVTPFGEKQLPVREIDSLRIGGTTFHGNILMAKVGYPLIGSDFLFSKNNVLLSRAGLKFDVNYNKDDALACVGMAINYEGNTTESPVSSVYLLLDIDGSKQEVFLDTGKAPAFEATALAPKSKAQLLPRLDLLYNALGQWKLAPYFYRQASLSLGNRKETINFRHFYTDHSIDAPFVMGAGILKDYSILIDHKKGRACFFRPQ